MLLAVEERGGAAGAMKNFLGGKRDSWAETPRVAAAREGWEETGRLLSSAARTAIACGARPVAWAPRSKFALFMHELGPEDTWALATRISARGGPPDPVRGSTPGRVVAVPLRFLLDPRWRREEMHAFAGPQAEAILPAVRGLLASRLDGGSAPPATAASSITTVPPPEPRVGWERARLNRRSGILIRMRRLHEEAETWRRSHNPRTSFSLQIDAHQRRINELREKLDEAEEELSLIHI